MTDAELHTALREVVAIGRRGGYDNDEIAEKLALVVRDYADRLRELGFTEGAGWARDRADDEAKEAARYDREQFAWEQSVEDKEAIACEEQAKRDHKPCADCTWRDCPPCVLNVYQPRSFADMAHTPMSGDLCMCRHPRGQHQSGPCSENGCGCKWFGFPPAVPLDEPINAQNWLGVERDL